MNKAQFKEICNTAVKALLLNRVRTFLTMLGVIIGVFAVVSLVSLVKGVENFVQDQFEALGSNISFVYPGSGGFANDPAVSFTGNKLEEKHTKLIEREAGDYVEAVTPLTIFYKNTVYKTRSYYAVLTGAPPNYEYTNNLVLESGRFFTPLEDKSEEKVAVLGPEVKKELFGRSNAIGEKVKIEDKSYEIIGVMEKKGPDWDEQIVIPMNTLEREFDTKIYTYIMVKFYDDDNIEEYNKRVELALLRDLKPEDFTLYSQADLLESFQSILNIISIGLGSVAGISLFVGGIGIMNIMLVSVRERIREIGLRKALGATKANIALQFIAESVLISVIGGFFGLIFGFGATLIARNWIRAEITTWSVLLAFGFSFIVGVVFGTYPAIDASKKDPIEALRYE